MYVSKSKTSDQNNLMLMVEEAQGQDGASQIPNCFLSHNTYPGTKGVGTKFLDVLPNFLFSKVQVSVLGFP